MCKTKVLFVFIFLFPGIITVEAQEFIANKGQWSEPFDYKIRFKNVAVFVDANGLRMNLRDPQAFAHFHDEQGRHVLPKEPVQHHGIAVAFNAGAQAHVEPQRELPTYHNYFLGNSSARWQTNVPLYEELLIAQLYTGIDMVMKPGPANLKYDLIVSPKADISQIRFTYRGANNLFLSNGRLVIQTAIGRVVEEEPIAWQRINGTVIHVPISFVLEDNNVTFKVGEYNENYELIIDPNFIFSTYTGSTSDNFGFTATFDDQGNSYGGGIVFGFGYPTVGAFEDSLQGGFDVSISKFSQDGTSLIYSTYLGGIDNDQPHSMVVDNDGNLVVLGVTGSNNFPVTPTAFDTSYNGGPGTSVGWAPFVNGVDIFITKFSASGSALVGSTFLGGTDSDGSNQQLRMNYGDAARGEIITDMPGNVFFASVTNSTDFPTAGMSVFQTSLAGGQEAVIGKLNADLSNLDWCTFMGGTLDDAAYSLKLNAAKSDVFVAGGTSSNNFPVSTNAYQVQSAGSFEGWIASFNAQSGSYTASTYNGTSENDQNFFITLDRQDDLYVFGQTRGNYPVTAGLWSIPGSAQFLHKFDANLQQSYQSIVFGSGSDTSGVPQLNISPTALMVDPCLKVYLSGWGGLTNFEGSTFGLPVTPDAFDSITDGSDFYFMVLDGSWQFLEYATFLGGNGSAEHVDGGTSRFSPEGVVHQAVCAGCGGTSLFPAFPSNVVSTTNNSSNCNLACLKIDFDAIKADVNIALDPDTACLPHLLSFIDNSDDIDIMTWDFGDGDSFTGRNPVKTYDVAGTYMLTIIGIDTVCDTRDTNFMSLTIIDTLTQASFTATWDTCSQPFEVNLVNQSTNAFSYFWDFGDGTTSTLQNPAKTYTSEGSYFITLVAENAYCGSYDTATLKVVFKGSVPSALEFEMEYEPCVDASTVRFSPIATGYQLFNWDFGDGQSSNQRFPVHSYSEPGTFTVTLQTQDTICGITATESRQITIVSFQEFDELLPNVFTPNNDGNNDFWKTVDNLSAGQFEEFKVEVYNRWGNLVYTTYDPGFAWDGTYDQTELAEGVYFWLVWYRDICGNDVEENGIVHIIK
jgi:gliding motility-associated-like protein